MNEKMNDLEKRVLELETQVSQLMCELSTKLDINEARERIEKFDKKIKERHREKRLGTIKADRFK